MGFEANGILEKTIKQFEQRVIENKGIVKPENIVEFQHNLQNNEYDSSIIFCGANGSAKSMSALAVSKMADPEVINDGRILYSFDRTSKFINLLGDSKTTGRTIMVDELKTFFHYKRSMMYEQIALMNMIEYARSNRVGIIGCANDIRRINNNYRNAKVQMIIWLLDRYDDIPLFKDEYGYKAYGLVFIGNPALEEEDKFGMNNFRNVHSFEQIRVIAEALPTFYGYFFIENINKYLTEEEIKKYRENKQEGIKVQSIKIIEKLDKKEEEEMEKNSSSELFNNIWNKFKPRQEKDS